MNPCALSRRTIAGFDSLRLSNGLIEADIIPSLGGKVWNLMHIPSKTQWIWHNPNVNLKEVSTAANYDGNWAGGWEELFPNDAQGEFEGRTLPDHGEWWSRSWTAEVLEDSPEKTAVMLTLEGQAIKTRCEKLLSLEAGSNKLTVSYKIENLEAEAFHFLFKQHLALAVGPKHKIELPGGTVTPVDLAFSTRIKKRNAFSWPGKDPDLSALPPAKENQREFVYVSGLPQGWCGARDLRTGAGLKLRFNRKIFPFTWLFMTYGGWRGLYTVVLEPCTNIPKDLNAALKRGACAELAPGKTLETTVSVELS